MLWDAFCRKMMFVLLMLQPHLLENNIRASYSIDRDRIN